MSPRPLSGGVAIIVPTTFEQDMSVFHGKEDDVWLRNTVGLDVAYDIVEHTDMCEPEGHLHSMSISVCHIGSKP